MLPVPGSYSISNRSSSSQLPVDVREIRRSFLEVFDERASNICYNKVC